MEGDDGRLVTAAGRSRGDTLPTLPISAPLTQSGPVWSRKFRICEVILPKRVGVPKMMPS